MNTAPGSGLAAAGSSKNGGEVDKEAFLKLLITQLQNQDPLSPMEGTEFVSQLAEFSSVEQAIAQSQHLEVISMQLTGIASNEAVGLIGKDVTVRGRNISFDGVSPTGFSANLDDDASEVTVTIRDANGNAVKTMEMGPQDKGAVKVPWDGRNDAGTQVPAGNYTVDVTAKDGSGNPVSVSQDVRGKVVGISFEKGYPEVILDNGARAPISDLIAVHDPGGALGALASLPGLPGSDSPSLDSPSLGSLAPVSNLPGNDPLDPLAPLATLPGSNQ